MIACIPPDDAIMLKKYAISIGQSPKVPCPKSIV
jgi:hypothetical protein